MEVICNHNIILVLFLCCKSSHLLTKRHLLSTLKNRGSKELWIISCLDPKWRWWMEFCVHSLRKVNSISLNVINRVHSAHDTPQTRLEMHPWHQLWWKLFPDSDSCIYLSHSSGRSVEREQRLKFQKCERLHRDGERRLFYFVFCRMVCEVIMTFMAFRSTTDAGIRLTSSSRARTQTYYP